MKPWIGVDLDGTLAHYEGWGHGNIGKPIPLMMRRVRRWIKKGWTVKVLTARVAHPGNRPPIVRWLRQHGLGHLEITAKKDLHMIQLWDDRCVQVIPNTGKRADGK